MRRCARRRLPRAGPDREEAQQFEQESSSKREDKAVGAVINLIEVAGSQQVMLEVKVAEMARTEVAAATKFNAIAQGQPTGTSAASMAARRSRRLSRPDACAPPAFAGRSALGPGDRRVRAERPVDREHRACSELSQTTIPVQYRDRCGQGEGAREDPGRADADHADGPGSTVPVRRRVPDPGRNGSNGITIEFEEFGVGLKFLPVVLSDTDQPQGQRQRQRARGHGQRRARHAGSSSTLPRAGADEAQRQHDRRAQGRPDDRHRRPHQRQPAGGRDQVPGPRRPADPRHPVPQPPVPERRDGARDPRDAAPCQPMHRRIVRLPTDELRRAERQGLRTCSAAWKAEPQSSRAATSRRHKTPAASSRLRSTIE